MTSPRRGPIRLLLWHKIALVLVGTVVMVTASLTLSTWRAMARTEGWIQREGERVLSAHTEQFLSVLIQQRAETLDAQLSHARSIASHASVFLSQQREGDAGDAAPIQKLLAELTSPSRIGASICVVSPAADLHCRPETTPGVDRATAGRLLHEAASAAPLLRRRSGETAWSPLHKDPLSRSFDLVVDAISPIMHGEERWGFVVVSVSLNKIVAEFNQHQPVADSYSFLISPDARLIGAPPQGRVDLSSEGAYQPRGLIDLRATGSATLDAALRDMALGAAAVHVADIKGEPKYLAFRPLDSIEWRIGLVVSEATATAASQELAGVIKSSSLQAIPRMLASTGLLLALVLILGALLARRLAAPLHEMASITAGIVDGSFDRRVVVTSTDEIGELGQDFNAMAAHVQRLIGDLERRAAELGDANAALMQQTSVLERAEEALRQANDDLERRVEERTRELAEAQRKLVSSAHEAGMAEVATSVLHNVGNVLNSVNVAASLASEKVRSSRLNRLAQVAGMLNEQGHDLPAFFSTDERAQKLPVYLTRLAEQGDKERQDVLCELTTLRKSIDHIRNIVALQQCNAKKTRVMEAISLAELVDDALRLCPIDVERHGIELALEIPGAEAIMLERHKVMQILVNLISNAHHALLASSGPRRLLIRGEVLSEGTVRVEVSDNGVGIAPEHLTQIFQHGFTTRSDGHGFGLHASALAAKGMGGSLAIRSDGPGKGATFTLDLRCERREGSA